MTVVAPAIEAWAAEAITALENDHQIAPFSAAHPAFSLADAYRVTAAVQRLRTTRGEMPVGRKIGFTNRITWPDYAPMWGYVYDRTVYDRTVYDLADGGSVSRLRGWPSRASSRRSPSGSGPR